MSQRMVLVAQSEFDRLVQNVGQQVTQEPVVDLEPESRPDILELLNPRFKPGAIQLLAAFRQRFTPEQFTWDSKSSEVSIGGEKIRNSNISDLITVLLHPIQNSNVKGLDKLILLLKENNFPSLLVRNRKIRQSLLSIPETIQEEEPKSENPLAEMEALLDDLYYDETKKSAFRGVVPLYRAAKALNPEITVRKVKDWLKSQPTYTIWRQAKRNYPRNKFKIQLCEELMQFDLMVQKETPQKDPDTGVVMKYAMIAQDSYSRFTFCVPLSANKSKDIQDAIQVILDTGYKPQSALGDKAGEHISASTRTFFKSKDIHFYTTSSKTKAPQAERYIRTARTFIRRYQNSKNTLDWLEPLKLCVAHYNHTKSRVTGQTPADIMTSEEADRAAFRKMYGQKVKRQKKVAPNRNAPKPGDKVRLSRLKGTFDKESGPSGNWTREYFTVSDISKSQKLPMYGLTDTRGKKLEGRAYSTELQQIDVDADDDLFEIQKVWKKQKKHGKMMALVSWTGYTRLHNSWIPVSDLRTLKQGTRNKNVH